MSRRPPLSLDEPARITLEEMRDHHPKPYLRERAAALLKIADGMAPARVAREGLLKPRYADTVYDWLDRYLAEGIAGLAIKPGGGRKPAFAPRDENRASAEIERLLQQSPRRYGIPRSRWRIQDVGRALAWLQGLSEPGIYKVLKRLGFSRKQALNFIRSPDPEYRAKWQRILAAYQEAWTNPESVVLVFLDELTYYRQPTKSQSWHRQGDAQPKAHQAPRSNTKTRVVAILNAVTGQVDYRQRSTIGQAALIAFYAQIREAYPQATKIYVAQDNWPVHQLDPVLDAAAAQQVTPLFLPTYASWLNPIEKLWRWLKQAVLHLHPTAHEDKLVTLRQQVCDFLDQFAAGSLKLLHYVGILSREELLQTTGLNC